jgi:hypothetical protein
MSFLKKSLEKRIKELRKSIEAQKTELAAYEQVLALETGKPTGIAPAPAAVAAMISRHTKTDHLKTAPKPTPAAASSAPVTVEFNGSRSDFVASVVKQRGSTGITPPEISAAFAVRKVAVSKNLVYNVLSLLFKQKRVRKSGGRYYHIAGTAAAPAAAPSATPKKSRISEEGMGRIIAATKKRWARQRAAKGKAK